MSTEKDILSLQTNIMLIERTAGQHVSIFPLQVFIEGECVEVFGFDKCQGFGEMLRWTAEGKVAENTKRTRLTRM